MKTKDIIRNVLLYTIIFIITCIIVHFATAEKVGQAITSAIIVGYVTQKLYNYLK